MSKFCSQQIKKCKMSTELEVYEEIRKIAERQEKLMFEKLKKL